MKCKKYILSELATIKYGKNQKKVVSDNGNIPIFGTGGLMGFASESLYDKPSVLIGRKGTIGKVKYVEQPFWTVDTLFYTIVNTDVVIPKYLYYLMSLIDLDIYNEGTTIPSLRTETLNRLEFDIPSLEEQRKILSCINPIDDKIEINNAINNNLEQQAKALFKSWFVDFDPFGGVQPHEMQFVPLQYLCEVVTKGATPTTLGKPFTTSGINFIKAESILDNHSIDSGKFAYIDEETNYMLKRSIIKSNDIVFTIAGTLGRFALVDESILPVNTNQAVAIIRPDNAKISPTYLYSFFIGNWHNEYYSKRVQQAVQANLSLTTIKSLPIALFDKKTMEQYDELVRPLFAMMKNNEEENRKLSALRDSLLPKLMSGELDVSNIDL